MRTVMKRFGTLAVAAVMLVGGVSYAKVKITSGPDPDPTVARHPPITDPKVYIPLREEMTRMEMRFVDVQIMTLEDKVDFKAIAQGLADMEDASKKIRKINPNEALVDPLAKLGEQLKTLQRDAKRKDLNAVKGNLDLLFQTCFKCHQSHTPMTRDGGKFEKGNL